MSDCLSKFDHVVVPMLENRSFDSVLGSLYAKEKPKHFLPRKSPTNHTEFSFEGIDENLHYNTLNGQRVYVKTTTTSWDGKDALCVPTPDPHENFTDITAQIFGSENSNTNNEANMNGFLDNYATTDVAKKSAAQIMQCYAPSQLPVLSALARQFAVSDHWFASVPAQTWPNRGFVHSGTSTGYVNNGVYLPYNTPTIFNILQSQNIPWGVFCDVTHTGMSLTHIQFRSQLKSLTSNFHKIEQFEELCKVNIDDPAERKLPAYSFIEPRFQFVEGGYPNDFHRPHNVKRGEQFVLRIYNAIRNCDYRDNILFLITFDEHGGCYDHLPPASGAVAPEPGMVSRKEGFKFDRFGIRVPTIVISSHVSPATIFRSPTATPYDHTSILATLRDWKSLDKNKRDFLTSKRIAQAPTLAHLFDTPQKQHNNWIDIELDQESQNQPYNDEDLDTPVNDLQIAILAGELAQLLGIDHIGELKVKKLTHKLRCYRDLALVTKKELLKLIQSDS